MIAVTTIHTTAAAVVARAVGVTGPLYADEDGFAADVASGDAVDIAMTEDPVVAGLYVWRPPAAWAMPAGWYVFRFYVGATPTGSTQTFYVHPGATSLIQNGVTKTVSSDL